VLTLNGTVTDEGLLVFDVSKRIEVSKRGNSTNSIIEFRGSKGGGGLGLLGKKGNIS
jgi:hypothetical protein